MLQIKAFLFCYFVLCITVTGFTQRNANWYFGSNAAIKFTSTGPVAVSGSQINSISGCSTISDENGNLLFYTNGLNVWNKNNVVMTNGTGLRSYYYAIQSCIIVPAPGNNNKYYIFTVGDSSTNNNVYCYSVVDMNLQGGLGEVIVKNVVFDSLSSGRLTASIHKNRTDFWVITNSAFSNTFKAFQLNSNGLSATPVINNIGNISTTLRGGMCKVSEDGNWLVQTTISGFNYPVVQLFRFNNETGVLSNQISLYVPLNSGVYGCSFSPNSNRLYLSNPTRTDLLQYTLRSGNQTSINNSLAYIPTGFLLYGNADLAIGPDQKIYLAKGFTNRLSCLNNPNDSAINANFIDTAVILNSPAFCGFGLPQFYSTFKMQAPQLNIKIDTVTCLTYKFSIYSSTTNNYQGIYQWDFGDGSTKSYNSIASHSFIRTTEDSFLVKLNFRSADSTLNINLQRWLVLPKKPVAAFSVPTNSFINDSLRFINTSTSANGMISQYIWWLGDGSISNAFIPAKKYVDTGTYNIKLLVKDVLGCLDSSSVQIKVITPIVIPNAFSPNNDGINDKWVIPSLKTYTNCEVLIFNRQGQKVYSSKGYNSPWDGTMNGQSLPVSTYYYVINLGNDKPKYTGWLYLIR